MSDFLGRMAARAVGGAPLAEPRLPALFEQVGPSAGPDASPAAVSVDDTALSPPAPAAAAGSRPTRLATELAPPSAPGGLGGANLAHHATAPSAGEPDRFDLAQLSTAAASIDRPRGAVLAASPGDDTGVVAAPEIAPSAAVPAVLASAIPLRADVSLPDGPGPSSEGPVSREDDSTVRVHIGRLEVRASLQEPSPTPPPRPAAAPQQGLSLSDYLRGRRGAG